MKVIIAGGRDIDDWGLVNQAILESGYGPTTSEVVSGGASGVDGLGEAIADKCGIAIKRFPADWKKHGKSAGPLRQRARLYEELKKLEEFHGPDCKISDDGFKADLVVTLEEIIETELG